MEISCLFGTKYSRMDQAKLFKSCFPQILLGPFLNTLFHLLRKFFLVKTYRLHCIMNFPHQIKIYSTKFFLPCSTVNESRNSSESVCSLIHSAMLVSKQRMEKRHWKFQYIYLNAGSKKYVETNESSGKQKIGISYLLRQYIFLTKNLRPACI